MFRSESEEGYVSFCFSSEMRLVDRAIQQCADFAKQLGVQDCPSLKTVLRELMINAIEHGNQNDEEKEVCCRMEALEGSRFKIVVSDQGSGFDTSNLATKLGTDATQERSRGYPLIYSNTDQVEFDEAGNVVTAYITETSETTFDVSEQDGQQVIRPSGNLTAATADTFRVRLLELIQAGNKTFRFDLDQVDDMDSVSLSVFLSFAKMLRKQAADGKIELVNVSKDIAQLLRMTRLDVTFNLVITLKDE